MTVKVYICLGLLKRIPSREERSDKHIGIMLIEFYIEALLVDEDLADQVCELWDTSLIDDETAMIAWLLLERVVQGN